MLYMYFSLFAFSLFLFFNEQLADYIGEDHSLLQNNDALEVR